MLDVEVNGEVQPWMGVPVSAELSKELHDVATGLCSDTPKEFVSMAMDTWINSAQAAEVYISESVRLLQVGIVLRKMASAAISAVKAPCA